MTAPQPTPSRYRCFGCQRLHVRKVEPCPMCDKLLGRDADCRAYDKRQGYTNLYCTGDGEHFMGRPPALPDAAMFPVRFDEVR